MTGALHTSRQEGQGGPDNTSLGVGWEGAAIGLLDLDAFFASVEQLDHPEWRGKPLIVGGDAERRGVVSTASYEARKFGVHSAMSAAQAKRLCPDAIWTHGHFDRYRELSSRVMTILVDETPLVEQVSIDEAFFDVTPGRYSKESPVDICRRIQTRVAALGITCSIGLGVCKSVAKIASEAEKPRGLTVVMPGTERSFLDPLPIKALSGVGQSTEMKLKRLGIHTLGQLARADTRLLERELGVAGPTLQARAAASERRPVTAWNKKDDPKSVSNERTFAEDLTDKEEILSALDALCAMVARRLRKKGLAGTTLTVRYKQDACTSKSAQAKLDEPADDEAAFSPLARELFGQIWIEDIPVRLIGVGVSSFEEKGLHQLNLFEDENETKKREAMRKLHVTTDELKQRFGENAVSFGRDIRLRGATTNTQGQNKEDA